MQIYVKAVHYDFYKRRIGELCDQFPSAFNKRFPYPLAIGIHKQLEERTSFSSEELSALLRIWTHRIEYLAMGSSVGSRVDLDGNLTLITPEHMTGFVAAHKPMGNAFVKRFSKEFLKVFGRPAFGAVPVSERKEIDFGTVESCSNCDNCPNCAVADRSNN